MMWLVVVAIVVSVVASIVAVRSLARARADLAASLEHLGELRVVADALAGTVHDVARRGGLTSDALAVPARS